jgi:hypothetical protein
MNFFKNSEVSKEKKDWINLISIHSDGIYSIPVFTKDFCQQLIEELKYFEASSMPKGRPNTMNNYGV